jgi:hypothetical protein
MLKWFKPEYRIIRNRFGSYEAQSRRGWWPFWTYVLGTRNWSVAEAEVSLTVYLEIKRGREEEVLYLGRL